MKRLIGDPLAALSTVLGAILIGVAFQGEGLSPLAWLGLIVIGYLVISNQISPLPAIAAGILLQLIAVDWMRHCFATLPLTESRVANWFLVGLLLGGVLPLVLLLVAYLRRRNWPLWLALPVAWTIGDFLRYQLGHLSGSPYPWVVLGLSQTDLLVVCQVADLGGVWAIGFLVTMIAGMVAQFALTRRVPYIPVLIAAAALIYGGWRLRGNEAMAGPRFALVPGMSHAIPDDVDFAMWPETAFDHHTVIESKAVLLQGCRRRSSQDRRFNSLAVISEERIRFYDKCNLVPWSEYAPWGGESQFVAGESLGIFTTGDYRYGVAICYDVCFPEFMRRLAEEKPQFIAVAANEASDPSQVLAHQLLSHTKLRAIEARRAIVRNANGGFSGVVDGNGRFTLSDARFHAAVTQMVPLDTRFAPYNWLGDWLPFACLILAISSSLHAVAEHRRRQQAQYAS